jgi:ubiquinone biosynthesis protein
MLPASKTKTFLRFLMFFYPAIWFRKTDPARAVRLRVALEELGPIFVKFGQTLSTRPDLFPDDIVIELSKLQDQVPAFSSAYALHEIKLAYGKPASEVFKEFSTEPLAAASVAQVHAATLPEGQQVIVKIVRPGIEKAIDHDIKLLYFLARQSLKRWPDAKRFRPVEVVAEFEKIIFHELDMLREAANASQLKHNSIGSQSFYVPTVYWEYCRPRVLVMERIYGVRVSDLEKLRAHGTDLKKLAERGVEIFYTQVFRDKFFHADMHPGNIFVDMTDPGDPKYLGVDFGIMGVLSDEDHHYLAQNFLAFFNRDYRKVAQLHVDSGWVPRTTRVDELEGAIRSVCEPIFNRPLRDISFATALIRLFQVARQFNMEVQPQLALLQKTLLNVEGLGRQLYPDLNLWETAKPHLESIMRQQLGVRGFFRKIHTYLPMWLDQLPELPTLVQNYLQKQTLYEQQLISLQAELAEYKKAQRKWRWSLGAMMAVIILGGLLLL